MDKYEQLNNVLLYLFNHAMDVEERVLASGNFKNISVNDMHIIDVIGPDGAKSMSALAKEVGVTVGTLTIAMNNLVKKGYVNRARSVHDRRVVLISLTEKGVRAFRWHERFYGHLIEAMREGMDEKECELLTRAMLNLKDYFDKKRK
ncbi:MAG TPA: winged helix-turn-helix transcriptional regulator [Candidatus Onthocola gallistercoris]|uniref:HTH-type transcriptional regulator SarZ n=1 Tax=Candidatus Onthocola gallistercoris TaxID=2840876 RepID=A0A9D1KX88_9FIRM|nr:winged helix-turn-helix transcriptional regulator [Candidatus Onthocola gallistercoris]